MFLLGHFFYQWFLPGISATDLAKQVSEHGKMLPKLVAQMATTYSLLFWLLISINICELMNWHRYVLRTLYEEAKLFAVKRKLAHRSSAYQK